MNKLNPLDDTIAAISTPLGLGGIGIVRLSGKEALSIANKMFVAKGSCDLRKAPSHTVHYGIIVDKKRDKKGIIDEVLITVMRAPKTYTKQDVVEINSHGSSVALKAILSLAIDLGARLAEPGEFTKRAFLNGRIDLTQAEAVLDIIQSKTEAFLRLSTNQLKGDLTLKLEEIREDLMNVYAQLEAEVNFPDEDTAWKGKHNFFNSLESAERKIQKLLDSSHQGKIFKEGIRIVICGKPNVGKSSLLNVLLKSPRAIVSEIAGTTRDTIEESLQIKGVPFQVIDTAGILKPQNIIEEEAVNRSRLYTQSADIVLFLVDASQRLSEEDRDLANKLTGQNVIVVINKCDLDVQLDGSCILSLMPGKKSVHISVLKKEGIDELTDMIVDDALGGITFDMGGVLISNLRHISSLKDALMAVSKAENFLKQNLSQEFISEEIKGAINSLDMITGRHIDVDLLDNIFSNFCIGK